ncbi:HPP family-domain-containing protein [Zychaea mexicana]|uniref:HPP family-domain-containing protein n=1 Tax=Zychaea mexicana TaxID=64656 RepID=UPI0022FEE221|nr:HPP family-domain-containing protein [Zychaea mexicana]KAI9498024.1 HPP family-domain-containing protein [Zychaea mexicana]
MGDYLDKLARCVKHFLGRREEGTQRSIPLWRTCLWSFVGAFTGLSLLEILFSYTQAFQDLNVPMIAASCGATAVLIYGAIEAPLAQPRAMIGGNLIASFVGVCIHKLFLEINTPDQYVTHVRWVGGATSVSLTIVLMQLTKTTHPPSGATSLLPMATPEIGDLGWLYIGIIMLSSAILLVVALLVDNIERRYPTYWWTVTSPPSKKNDIEMSLGSNDSSKETVAEEQSLVIFGQAIPQDMLNSDEEEFLRKLAGRFQNP